MMRKNRKTFIRYVIPSTAAMLVTMLYVVVDGIFVGQGVGTNALAAVNLSLPFVLTMGAVSMMFTMGSAAVTAVRFGRGEKAGANQAFMVGFVLVLFFSLLFCLLGVLFPSHLAKAFGASPMLLEETAVYIRFYAMFDIFFCLSMFLAAAVRNDGNPALSMWAMLVGAISNIFLDWLFIFPLQMGVSGAAIASGIGQVLSCILLLFHFVLKKGNLCIRLKDMKYVKEISLCRKIVLRGTPEFVTQMNQSVTVFCYNLVVFRILGEMGVSAFAVVTYLLSLSVGLFTGVSQGVQPLFGRSFGNGDKKSEQNYFKLGIITNAGVALSIYLILFFFGKQIIPVFNGDSRLISIADTALKVYGISFIFAALNIIFTIYFLSTKQTSRAVLVSVLRSFLLNTLFIFLLPAIFGEKALWGGIIVAEFFTFLAAIYLKRERA